MKINEEFISFIWQHKLFDLEGFEISNQQVQLLGQGTLNNYSGPDFFNAKVKIGETIWAGNVELHVKTSDWFKHKHQVDPAYNNVILHVVFENDLTQNKQLDLPPVIELKGRIKKSIIDRYNSLSSKTWIPCGNSITSIDRAIVDFWLERLAIERTARKVEALNLNAIKNTNDLEEVLYTSICTSFGLKANALPFSILAEHLPFKMVSKYLDSQVKLEALFMGQAGFLHRELDVPYFNLLKREYEVLRTKHKLDSLSVDIWKVGGVRPSNQPLLKIAQLVQFLKTNFPLVNSMSGLSNINQINNLFNIEVSDYWKRHTYFGKLSKNFSRKIGRNSTNAVVINSIIPFLFYLSDSKNLPQLKDIGLSFLNEMKPEINSITEGWKNIGLIPNSALQSQALLELKNNYCENFNCLSCSVGHKLIRM